MNIPQPMQNTTLRLVKSSNAGRFDPFSRIEYQPSLDPARLQFPEDHISIFRDEAYRNSTDEVKWKLSLLEMINFFSLNIHGERALIKDLSDRIHSKKRLEGNEFSSEYIHHFIHEENAHSYMLSRYCYKYGSGVMPDLRVDIAQPRLSAEAAELLFYSKVYVLEVFLAYMNVCASKDTGLDLTVRDINHHHHLDEIRHISWDMLAINHYLDLLKHKRDYEALQEVKRHTLNYRNYVIGRLYSPLIYKSAGIEDYMGAYERSRNDPERAALTSVWMKKADMLIASFDSKD